MLIRKGVRITLALAGLALAMMIGASAAFATVPVVKTVPWVATNPLVSHDTYPGKAITLKGTSDHQGATWLYKWDFGDGSAVATGAISNMYDVEATHTYTGSAGTVYTATLTVTDNNTGDNATQHYYTTMQVDTLQVEVNVAIDEGLWYLHKTEEHAVDAASTLPIGYWYYGPGNASSGYPGNTALNINAFEVNGHLEAGPAADPYTETVQRAMRWLMSNITSNAIYNHGGTLGKLKQTGLAGNLTFDPDTNSNGISLSFIAYSDQYVDYQHGMAIDAIVASGTKNAVAVTGSTNVLGRKYVDIVQDMVDFYLDGQYENGNYGYNGGGWGYWPNFYSIDYNDNSVSQWAAIGIIAAEQGFGITIPQAVKDWNKVWLGNDAGTGGYLGTFGYAYANYFAWVTMATTPSGLVQLVLDGAPRTDALWGPAETYLRDNFCSAVSGGSSATPRAYYYGLFSFTKAMLLQSPAITKLHSTTAGVNDFDWYNAVRAGASDTTNDCDGVAKTLVKQQTSGYWSGHNYSGAQYPLETAMAIIMLNRTVFSAGAPVAVAVATPNPGTALATITLDGSGSYHQDATKSIVQWDWDTTGTPGVFDLHGVNVSRSWPAVGTYPVTLQVTDNVGTTASTILNVVISVPPVAPTANAGGPYNFCPLATPWILDASKTPIPNGGAHDLGAPADFITAYLWDLTGGTTFPKPAGSSGVMLDVTSYFTTLGVGNYLVDLQVTDNAVLSFPSAKLASNLNGTSTAQVHVLAGTDPNCTTGCISGLASLGKNKQVQLTWTPPAAGTDHYNVYRSTALAGPYALIGTAPGTAYVYFDYTVTNGTTYYYEVRPAALNGNETCQPGPVQANPVGPKR